MRTKKHEILLVEDEILIAMAEAQMLEKHGFIVKTVLNGKEAVQKGCDKKTSLILMDINLGKDQMDGTEAAKKILTECEVPIIFLTSHSEHEYTRRIEGITQYGYLLKHEDQETIISTIENAIDSFNATPQ